MQFSRIEQTVSLHQRMNTVSSALCAEGFFSSLTVAVLVTVVMVVIHHWIYVFSHQLHFLPWTILNFRSQREASAMII